MYAGRTRSYDCPRCGAENLVPIDIQPEDHGLHSCSECEEPFRWEVRDGEDDLVMTA